MPPQSVAIPQGATIGDPGSPPQGQPAQSGGGVMSAIGNAAIGVGKSLAGSLPFMTPMPYASKENQQKAEAIPGIGAIPRTYRKMQEALEPHGAWQNVGYWGASLAQLFAGGGESSEAKLAGKAASEAGGINKAGELARERKIPAAFMEAAKERTSDLHAKWQEGAQALDKLISGQFINPQAIQKELARSEKLIDSMAKAPEQGVAEAQNVIEGLKNMQQMTAGDIKPLVSDLNKVIESTSSRLLGDRLTALRNALEEQVKQAATNAGQGQLYDELKSQYRRLSNWERAYARILQGKGPAQITARAAATPSHLRQAVGVGEVGAGLAIASHEPAFGTYVAARGAERIGEAGSSGEKAAASKVTKQQLKSAEAALEALARRMGMKPAFAPAKGLGRAAGAVSAVSGAERQANY